MKGTIVLSQPKDICENFATTAWHRTSHCYFVDATVSCFPARRRNPSPGPPLLPEPGSSRLHRALPNINGRTAPLPRRTSAVRDASSDLHRRLSPPPRTAVRHSAPGSGNFGGHRTGPDSGEEVPPFSLSLVPPQPSENHAGGCTTNPKIP
ncbi:hypothetical protein U1Q18_019715 [Sarracenia purpurea var. burkii]